MKDSICVYSYRSRLGSLILGSRGKKLCLCLWSDAVSAQRIIERVARLADATIEEKETTEIKSARSQLEEYFHGQRESFEMPVELFGTDFQKEVWSKIMCIPKGKLKAYSEIAAEMGRPKAYRAVAQALGENPLNVVVPCHRVITKGGASGGYAGGEARKHALIFSEYSQL